MSRKNKVNPDHYKVAGRLAPDDLARERMKQGMAKTARDWDGRISGFPASTGRGGDPAPASETDSGKSRVTPPATGTKKKHAPEGSPAQRARTAAGTKMSGRKKAGRRSPPAR
jgi:hypothetical protein